VIHGIFSVLSPKAKHAVCVPNSSWNPNLFSWSTTTATLLPLCLFAGHLRLFAFRQLQKSFTFRLAKPSKLVTSGIYAWLQHPSYTGVAVLSTCYAGIIIRADGILACWMHCPVSSLTLQIFVHANMIFISIAILLTYPARIVREEALLRKCFGQEWEEYHRSTARLIPWLF
jgi:protein-S-isoprenylcysteine O-methyltransferase Ste14